MHTFHDIQASHVCLFSHVHTYILCAYITYIHTYTCIPSMIHKPARCVSLLHPWQKRPDSSLVCVCTCMCVFVCARVCTCMCVCIYVCVHVCVYVCIHGRYDLILACVCVYMYVCMYVCIHAYMHTYTRAGQYLPMHAYICMFKHGHTQDMPTGMLFGATSLTYAVFAMKPKIGKSYCVCVCVSVFPLSRVHTHKLTHTHTYTHKHTQDMLTGMLF